MDIVHNHVVGEACAEPCIDLWLSCPKEVSVLNQIQISEFACAVRTLPEMVRGKHRNILFVRPANSAKTFILKLLQNILGENLLEHPANDKFGLGRAQKASACYLMISAGLMSWLSGKICYSF